MEGSGIAYASQGSGPAPAASTRLRAPVPSPGGALPSTAASGSTAAVLPAAPATAALTVSFGQLPPPLASSGSVAPQQPSRIPLGSVDMG